MLGLVSHRVTCSKARVLQDCGGDLKVIEIPHDEFLWAQTASMQMPAAPRNSFRTVRRSMLRDERSRLARQIRNARLLRYNNAEDSRS